MIGIGITTHNRQQELEKTLAAIHEFGPLGIPVVVVDDGSTVPATLPSFGMIVRHEVPQGIPAAKNRCLSRLYELGVQHFFLFDDDTRPAAPDWWVPYVESPEPHLQYCWTHFANGFPVEKMTTLYQDSHITAYGWSEGCMLYVERKVIDKVGGLNPAFGMGMEEHAEWSQRIHNASFTTFVHQDISDSAGLFYAGDEHQEVTRSLALSDRMALLRKNTALRESLIDSTDFVEFREYAPALKRNVVLTSFFNGQPDPQRGIKWRADTTDFSDLTLSCGKNLVVLHDCFGQLTVENQRVEAPLCAYEQRWLSQWQWLRNHPEVEYVWLVDATDVKMLRDPWPHMQPGVLYCGYEPKPVDCEWIRNHCPSELEDWVDQNAQKTLLNCGVVGGDRDTVMRLCQKMVDLRCASDRRDPLYEMLFFNVAAYSHPNMVTGPVVVTLFKANESNSWSMWKHK